jgi:hypothetical protein
MPGGGRFAGIDMSDNNNVDVSLLFTHFKFAVWWKKKFVEKKATPEIDEPRNEPGSDPSQTYCLLPFLIVLIY